MLLRLMRFIPTIPTIAWVTFRAVIPLDAIYCSFFMFIFFSLPVGWFDCCCCCCLFLSFVHQESRAVNWLFRVFRLACNPRRLLALFLVVHWPSWTSLLYSESAWANSWGMVIFAPSPRPFLHCPLSSIMVSLHSSSCASLRAENTRMKCWLVMGDLALMICLR